MSMLRLDAQVNPDDELIPSQAGANDNPVRHKLYTPVLQSRIVFGKGERRISKETKKHLKLLEGEKTLAASKLKARMFSGEEGRLKDCDVCLGMGIEQCSYCSGLGYNECPVCHGVKDQKCKRCDGAGLVFDQKCTSCEGTGVGTCKSCSGMSIDCKQCAGIGHFNCKKCKGVGKIFYSKQDSLAGN